MPIDSNEKRYNSKLFRFFDLLYRLLVLNIMTIIISLPLVTFFPAIVAMISTLKYNSEETGIFKPFFRNFKKYFWKSFKMGLVLLVVVAIACYAYYFWIKVDTNIKGMKIAIQLGVVVMMLSIILLMFICGHIAHLICTVPKLPNFQIFKTAFYMTFRYFLTTLIILLLNLVAYGSLVIILTLVLSSKQISETGDVVLVVPNMVRFMFVVWTMIGISLPKFLAIRLSKPVYYELENIDFDKMFKQIEEEIVDE